MIKFIFSLSIYIYVRIDIFIRNEEYKVKYLQNDLFGDGDG